METTLSCPRCRAALEASSDSQWRCASCGGALLGRDAVRDLLAAADEGKLPVARPSGYREPAGEARVSGAPGAEDETVRYLPCPMCQALMLRTRVLCDEPAVADVCVLHALFFDRGELERIMLALSQLGEGSRAAVRPLIAKHFSSGREPSS